MPRCPQKNTSDSKTKSVHKLSKNLNYETFKHWFYSISLLLSEVMALDFDFPASSPKTKNANNLPWANTEGHGDLFFS